MGITSSLIDESVSKAIKEMYGIEGRRKGKSIETLDEAETKDEEAALPAGWKNWMEETVNRLVAENATQRTLLKEQGEQMVKDVDLVRRMISWMEERPDSAQQRPIPISTPKDVGPSTTPVHAAVKRKTTTDQPSAAESSSTSAKRAKPARQTGSQESQKQN